MIRHIVMWNLSGKDSAEKQRNIEKLKASFLSLRNRIPGMLKLEIGIDYSKVDYACDVVLYSEFATKEDLAAYAVHPEHLRVKDEVGNMRIARHQVDYVIEGEDA